MISLKTFILILIIFGMYLFMMFAMVPYVRKVMKIIIYFLVFISLLMPDFDYILLPFGIAISFRVDAIILSGMELIDMCTKQIFERKLRNKKKLSKRQKCIYDSL